MERIIYFNGRPEDPNCKAYTEKLMAGGLKHLEGKFIAYQNQQIVGVESRGDLENLLEKVLGILKKDPIFIIRVGENHGMYLER